MWTYHLGRLSHGRPPESCGCTATVQHGVEAEGAEGTRAKSEKSSFYIILVHYFSVFNHNWYTFILEKFKSQKTIMQSHHPEIIAVPFLLPT